MKNKNKKVSSLSVDMKLRINRLSSISKKCNPEKEKHQYNTQEVGKRSGETSELIIEGNTVYEIDKECEACLPNKK